MYKDFNKVFDELYDAGYRNVKTSFAQGYVSRKEFGGNACTVESYSGRYGVGYKVKKPYWQSNRYCICEYWTKEENVTK